MIATSTFIVTAALSPLLALKVLQGITKRGPQAADGQGAWALASAVALLASMAALMADPGFLKLVVLSVSGLSTAVFLMMSMMFGILSGEFSGDAR